MNATLENLLAIPADGFWYLATPYTNFHAGHKAAADAAGRITARLLFKGVVVYSPIVHGHAVDEYRPDDANVEDEHVFWQRVDRPIMAAAHGIIMAKLVGWEESRGMYSEWKYFADNHKPVAYLEEIRGDTL